MANLRVRCRNDVGAIAVSSGADSDRNALSARNLNHVHLSGLVGNTVQLHHIEAALVGEPDVELGVGAHVDQAKAGFVATGHRHRLLCIV